MENEKLKGNQEKDDKNKEIPKDEETNKNSINNEVQEDDEKIEIKDFKRFLGC